VNVGSRPTPVVPVSGLPAPNRTFALTRLDIAALSHTWVPASKLAVIESRPVVVMSSPFQLEVSRKRELQGPILGMIIPPANCSRTSCDQHCPKAVVGAANNPPRKAAEVLATGSCRSIRGGALPAPPGAEIPRSELVWAATISTVRRPTKSPDAASAALPDRGRPGRARTSRSRRRIPAD
jgi:hypothetical protein